MKPKPLATFRLEPRQRRYLSAGLALAVAVSTIAVSLTMLDGYLQRREEIAQLTAEVGRLTERTADLAGRSSMKKPAPVGETDLVAQSADVAAAHLQAVLRGLAALLGTEEIQVDGVRVLPSQPEGAASAVRASASLTAPGPRVFDIVNALETATPPVIIDAIRVVSRVEAAGLRAPRSSGSEAPRAELTLILRVYALPEAVNVREMNKRAVRGQSQ